MPARGGPEDEGKIDPSIFLTRRELLKYGTVAAGGAVVLGGAFILGKATSGGESPSPSKTPQNPINITRKEIMAVEATKQAKEATPSLEKKGIFWQTEIKVEERSPGFLQQGNVVFFSDKDGFPVAYDFSSSHPQKIWEWKDIGRVSSVSGDLALIIDPLKRLHAVDLKTKKSEILGNFTNYQGYDIRTDFVNEGQTIVTQLIPIVFNKPSIVFSNYKFFWKGVGADGQASELQSGAVRYMSNNVLIALETTGISKNPYRFRVHNLENGHVEYLDDSFAYAFFSLNIDDESRFLQGISRTAIAKGNFLCFIKTPAVLWRMPQRKSYDFSAMDLKDRSILWDSLGDVASEILEVTDEKIYILDKKGDLWIFEVKDGSRFTANQKFGDTGFVKGVNGVDIIFSPQEGKTTGLDWSAKKVWHKEDIRLNEVVGVTSQGIVVGIYKDWKGREDSILTLFNLKTGEMVGRTKRVEKTRRKAILVGDKVFIANGTVLEVGDTNTAQFQTVDKLKDWAVQISVGSKTDLAFVQVSGSQKINTLLAVHI